MQFVLPDKFRTQALWACPDDIGHLGVKWSSKLLIDRFYWPSIANDVTQHVKSCGMCLRFKSKPHKAELQLIQTTHLLELVHLDFLNVESRKGKKEINIQVVIHHFTRSCAGVCHTFAHGKCGCQNYGKIIGTLWFTQANPNQSRTKL